MRNLFGILFVLLFTCSCANDPGDRTPDAYPVRFASGLSGEVLSRAANDSWEADDEVGIYMVPATVNVSDAANFSAPLSVLNKQYQTSGAGTSVSMAAVGNDAIYYPVDGSSVNFVAYYPYNAATHATNNNIYKVDVATQSPSKNIDLIYYKGTGTSYNKESVGDVSMTFTHQLSKMKINLVPVNGAHFTSASVQLNGFPTTADFNLSTGVLDTPGGTSTELTPVSNVVSDNANFEAILVPHSNGTRTVEFTIDGNPYIYTLSPTSVFAAGVAQSYNFKFTGSKIVLAQSTIVNWDGGTVAWGDYLLTATTIKFNLPNTLTTGNTVVLSTNAPSAPTYTLSEDANSVSGDASWITPVSLSDGTADTDMGDGWTKYTLTFGTNFNIAATERTGYIRLEVDGLTLAIRVTQAVGVGLYLNDPSKSLFDNLVALGKTGYEFTIVTNAQEDITLTPSPWITNLTKSRGAVDENGVSTWTVTFGVETNTGVAREGTIKVTVGGLEKTITVKQVAMYVNNPTETFTGLNVLAKAYTFTIETNAQDAQGSVTPTTADTWITGLSATRANKSGEDGNGIYVWTFGFNVSLNTTLSVRSGAIKVTIGGIEKTVAVSQVAMYVNNPSTASFSNLAYGGEAGKTFTIVTNAQDASVTPVCSDTWITANAVRGTVDGNGVSTWTVTFSVTANPNTAVRNGTIKVTIGGIEKTVNVSQDGKPPYTAVTEANCYMVAAGSSGITFNPTRAFTNGGAAVGAQLYVTKLWEDADCIDDSKLSVSGTGSTSVVTVVPNSTAGNALIAVRTGSTSGTIVWSYHIWVVPVGYDPDNSAYRYTNTYNTNKNGANFVFMDRNLGATTAGMGSGLGTGLFYQWGRKDPFPATLAPGAAQPGGGSFTAVQGPVALSVAIQNPDKFYYNGSSPYNWLNSQDNTLWGHGSTTDKSVYDPCPNGWRVPSHNVATGSYSSSTASPWSGFTTSNITAGFTNGYTWGTNGAYPAAGRRNNASGALSNVGTYGFVWSASPYSSTGASHLGFTSGSVGVNGSNSRAYGFSVRCVRE